MMHGAIIITCYTAVASPFEEPVMNRQEIVNEVSVCLSTYMLFAYMDLIGDMEILINYGWVSMGLIAGNIIINLLFMLCIQGRESKLRMKRFINHRKAKNDLLKR